MLWLQARTVCAKGMVCGTARALKIGDLQSKKHQRGCTRFLAPFLGGTLLLRLPGVKIFWSARAHARRSICMYDFFCVLGKRWYMRNEVWSPYHFDVHLYASSAFPDELLVVQGPRDNACLCVHSPYFRCPELSPQMIAFRPCLRLIGDFFFVCDVQRCIGLFCLLFVTCVDARDWCFIVFVVVLGFVCDVHLL